MYPPRAGVSPSQSRAIERNKAIRIWVDVQADAWPPLLSWLCGAQGRHLVLWCAVCPDEAWDVLTWATVAVERPTRLARSTDCGDNVADFLCNVVMDVGAGVRMDEIGVSAFCLPPPILEDDLHRGITPFHRYNVLGRHAPLELNSLSQVATDIYICYILYI